MKSFEQYDQENPQIWQKFVYFSRIAKFVKGFDYYSAKSIFELIRWHTRVKGNDMFKLNNNYHADYARKMMKEFPTFKGFFRTRQLLKNRKN